MPICPFCKKELDHIEVECYEESWITYNVYLNNDPRFRSLSNLVWEENEREAPEGCEIKEIYCPYCYSTLPLNSEDEVEEFFNGSLIILPSSDSSIRILNEKRILYKGRLYELRRKEQLVRCIDGVLRKPEAVFPLKEENIMSVLLLNDIYYEHEEVNG